LAAARYGPLWGGYYYTLALLRLPCDAPAAAAMLEDLASRQRLALAVVGVFMAVFIGVAAMVLSAFASAPVPGPFGGFAMVAAGMVAIALAVAGLTAAAALRRYRELRGAAAAIASGLMGREEYCEKTVLEVLYTYRARASARAWTPGRPPPLQPS